MKRFFVPLILLILIPGRVYAEPDETPTTGVNGVVFEPPAKSKTYWAPTESQILLLEKIFSPYLQYQINEYAASKHIYATPDQSKYSRQYIGIYRKSKKMIEISGMCGKRDLDELRKKIAVAKDGGWCYFTAQFDPEKNILIHFAFNGEA